VNAANGSTARRLTPSQRASLKAGDPTARAGSPGAMTYGRAASLYFC
jgi:hypothetical protein